ncbi:MAG: DUF4157 domain-containing protein, partial [Myxococcota bacterium]
METSLGADFSDVRIHEDGEAKRLGTLAFTRGADIHFAPGQYQPNSSQGQELLGHELTHVVQQSRGRSATRVHAQGMSINDDAALEREADDMGRRAARGQPASTPGRQRATPAPPSRVIQAKPDPTVSSELDAMELAPINENKRIAMWDGDRVSAEKVLKSHSGRGAAHFSSELAAIARITASGEAGAVFLENGRYVPYEVTTGAWFLSFKWDNVCHDESEPWTDVRFIANARVIVTEDGVPLRADQYKSERAARTAPDDEGLMPGADDGLAGHRSLLGSDAAKGMNRDAFLDALGAAMKSNALSVVHRARSEAEQYQKRIFGGSLPRQEITLMRNAARKAAQVQRQIDAIPDDRYSWKTLITGGPTIATHIKYAMECEPLRQEQRAVISRYPMLARFLDDIVDFAQLDESEQLDKLGGEAAEVMTDIDDTRENLIDGSLDLWIHRNIVESTLAGLGITDEIRRTWALDKSRSEQNWDTAGQIAMTVFAIGFGIGAAVFSGGTSLALAAGALGLGATDAIMQTQQYMVDSSAGNTALDPNQSLVPPDLAGHWGWLVVAWVGVGLDVADVVRVVRVVKGAGDAAKALDEGIELLAGSNKTLKQQLRVAAGHRLTPDDLVTLDNKDIIGRQLGAPVELSDDLGKEIRVHYSVDARGQVGVTRVTMGTAANVLDALAHTEVIRLLNRYRGAQGKLRQLWDRMRSFAGKASPDNNPFPPGSLAYESWLELKKIPAIIEARRAKLGTEVDKAREPLLRQDVEFLEGELRHHRQMVDQITL